MKLITPPFSQTQGGVACGINIKTNVDSKQMSTDDNTSYFWQECFTFSEIKKDQFYMQEVSARPLG